jgi:predicted NBD/HSP70 family sugar kinase
MDHVAEGDRVCTRLLEAQARALGTALVNVLNVLELDAVVITGEILYRGEVLRAQVETFINQTAINRRLRRVPVHLSGVESPNNPLTAAGAVAAERFFHGLSTPTICQST